MRIMARFLIFDEMITGFRWHLGGAQKFHGVVPHLSTFGKALGNGFAISALAGKREIMRLGGLDHDQARVFLLSTTHGAETHALAASLETLRIYRQQNVVEFLWKQGELLSKLINQSISENRLDGLFELLGRPCNLVFATRDHDGNPSQKLPHLVHAGNDQAGNPRAIVCGELLAQRCGHPTDC